ncbi:hypothetical protein PIROE2DRAFT_12397 [Piromyces sp. E2]|nr:hypothetical protein PIROE2DRAFT_12397 [Piromyces sp. E2]|eukprot:OUM61574.1 hypothetical protein PIROE2DRAFT_12397 [Piromyces sp. E2]
MKYLNFALVTLNAAIALAVAIVPQNEVKVTKEDIASVIDFNSFVKMHYDSPITDDQIANLLENGRDHVTDTLFTKNYIIGNKKMEIEIRNLIKEGLEEAEQNYIGEMLKRGNCSWIEWVICQTMKYVGLACWAACGNDKTCINNYCEDQMSCILNNCLA